MPIYNGIINQKGTPAFFSDIFANRPAFGYAGRVFISTDTGAIYEDTGSAWTLIADATGPVTSGTLQSVTTSGNTTNNGIVISANGLSSNSITNTGNTTGSVLFAGTSGLESQDNTNLFWDNTSKYLGIGPTGGPTAPLDIHNATANVFMQLNATGTNNSNIAFLNGGVGKWRVGNLYNAGANSFQIYDVLNSTARLTILNTGVITANSSITATSALAQGVNFSNTLVAAANSDVLVGLDINPTFTNGAFTGVRNYDLRLTNNLYGKGSGTTARTFGILLEKPSGTIPYTFLDAYADGSVQYISLGGQSGSSNYATNYLYFYTGSTTTTVAGTRAMAILPSGNINLGSGITDAGFKLDVNGTARIQGIATLAASYTNIGTTPLNLGVTNDGINFNAAGTGWIFSHSIGTNANRPAFVLYSGALAPTSGTTNLYGFYNAGSFNPSSGNANLNYFNISTTTSNSNRVEINTTGTYSGIIRGFYFNPTLTSITGATIRSIETVTGDVLLGTTSGSVGIGTTTVGSKLQVNGSVAIGYSASTAASSDGLQVNGRGNFLNATDNALFSLNSGATLYTVGFSPTATASSTNTLTLTTAQTTWIYTGTGLATWTLPTPSGTNQMFWIKNAGTGVITLNAFAGTNIIDNSATSVSSITIAVGATVLIQQDGNVKSYQLQ